jgi:starch phosphorylase
VGRSDPDAPFGDLDRRGPELNPIQAFLPRTAIAYFSMEIALEDGMNTYSGGLGVLAGDMARSAADLNMPLVFVSLVSRQGYVRQSINELGAQVSLADPWDPKNYAQPLPVTESVEIEGRQVWIQPWLYEVAGAKGRVPVLLLDTDVDANQPPDRAITDRLYGGGPTDRLKQEIVLGIGGEKVLRALGFAIRMYHLNEGHAALLPMALLNDRVRSKQVSQADAEIEVRQQCVFTTHTPVATAFDQFAYDTVRQVLGDFAEVDTLKRLAGADLLNMTQLALNLSAWVNGVGERHAETASRLFPGVSVRSITNGVHVSTWVHHSFAKLYSQYIPHWRHEPEVLTFADQIPADQVWAAHQEAKLELLRTVKGATGRDLDPALPLIGFARRITAYKRPALLFEDIARLRRIAAELPFQIVLAGIAHPADGPGLQFIADLRRVAVALGPEVPVVFLAGYNLALAKQMVAGSDMWLNTPLPPYEASGTSGMKAALNGVLNLSVLDGWWVEGCVDGVTGWSIGDRDSSDADELLAKLQHVVLPAYFGDRDRWVFMMKQAISKLGPLFNSDRMIRRYASEAYLA